jgi:hypothetical protein
MDRFRAEQVAGPTGKRSKSDATFAARSVTADQLMALFPLALSEAADEVGVRLNIEKINYIR